MATDGRGERDMAHPARGTTQPVPPITSYKPFPSHKGGAYMCVVCARGGLGCSRGRGIRFGGFRACALRAGADTVGAE